MASPSSLRTMFRRSTHTSLRPHCSLSPLAQAVAPPGICTPPSRTPPHPAHRSVFQELGTVGVTNIFIRGRGSSAFTILQGGSPRYHFAAQETPASVAGELPSGSLDDTLAGLTRLCTEPKEDRSHIHASPDPSAPAAKGLSLRHASRAGSQLHSTHHSHFALGTAEHTTALKPLKRNMRGKS